MLNENGKTEILAATGNSGKIRELKDFLTELDLRLRSLTEFSQVVEAEETGATFIENAVLKAKSYALQTNLWTLADDSGLEVDALDGAPGIFSARYAGQNATDEEKIAKLLQELNDLPNAERGARFACAMAVSDENGEIKFSAEGICRGRIALFPSGRNGFGYDPIFIPDGFDQTFGELSVEIKRKISHRAQAIAKIIQFLHGFAVPQLDRSSFRL